MAETLDRDIFRGFLLGLGEGMNAAADSVDQIRDTLNQVSRAYGRDEVSFIVLPTVLLIETGSDEDSRVAIRSAVNAKFRFDQIDALYRLIDKAKRAEITPLEGIHRLNDIGAMKPRNGWFLRVLGHAILTTGLALLLAPTWQGALVAFVLGALIGFAKLVRSPTLQIVFPIFAAFGCAVAVFLIAPYFAIGDPIRLLVAPLATFLPGGVLTTAVVELAAGQMLAGAARLVFGFVQLALLAFGILVAAAVVGITTVGYYPYVSTPGFPLWVAYIGVVLFAIGIHLHFSAPPQAFGWVLLVLFVAYGGQLLGDAFIGATVSGFTGALAMTPVVLWIASLRAGVPSQLTFLPAFWLLVPGAAGLVGLTEAIGTARGYQDFAEAITAIMSIALGVLIGSALYRGIRYGAQELAVFHIEVPGFGADGRPEDSGERGPSLFARLVPGGPHSFWGRRRVPPSE